MKKLLIIIVTFISMSCMSQDTYYIVHVHESNMEEIKDELSFSGDNIMWDDQTPKPVMRDFIWNDGFDYRPLSLKGNNIFYKITSGSFHFYNLEKLNTRYMSYEIGIENVMLGHETLYIYLENKDLKQSNKIIKTRNNILLLWRIDFNIYDGEIVKCETTDLRGFKIR